MAGTTRTEIVLETGLVTVGLFRARPQDAKFRESGPIDNDIIVFPRTCVSITHEGREPIIASPNVVVFYNRGQLYRRKKVSERGDMCDWFSFSREVLDEALSRCHNVASTRPGHPFGLTHGLSDAESFLAQRMVVEHIVNEPAPDRLLIEEAMLTVLNRIVEQAHRGEPAPRRVGAARGGSVARRRVARELQGLLAVGFRENLTLDRIASAFRYSPYELCRIFRRETGSTIHRYLNQIRLRTALEQVAGGHDDLSRLALDVGYSSHSHFTQAFRRAFGVPPSNARGLGSRRSILEMRKNLTV